MTTFELLKAFISHEVVFMPSRVLSLCWYLCSSRTCAGMYGCPLSELVDDNLELKPRTVRNSCKLSIQS